jgi:hypothetical protein
MARIAAHAPGTIRAELAGKVPAACRPSPFAAMRFVEESLPERHIAGV